MQQWKEVVGIAADHVGVKRTKTKWGSCNRKASGWRSSESAKKPAVCIEYIVVHQLIHLLAPTHNDRFVALLDQHLPECRPDSRRFKRPNGVEVGMSDRPTAETTLRRPPEKSRQRRRSPVACRRPIELLNKSS